MGSYFTIYELVCPVAVLVQCIQACGRQRLIWVAVGVALKEEGKADLS